MIREVTADEARRLGLTPAHARYGTLKEAVERGIRDFADSGEQFCELTVERANPDSLRVTACRAARRLDRGVAVMSRDGRVYLVREDKR